MTHMLITSCADMNKHIYICLIWTHCNQQYHPKHLYTYLSHYWHIPLNKYACHITQVCATVVITMCTCRSHIAAHMSKMNKFQLYLPCYNYVCAIKNIPLKWHICKLFHVQIWDNYISIYISYKLNEINNITTNTGMHPFHLLTYTAANMLATLCMYVPLHF